MRLSVTCKMLSQIVAVLCNNFPPMAKGGVADHSIWKVRRCTGTTTKSLVGVTTSIHKAGSEHCHLERGRRQPNRDSMWPHRLALSYTGSEGAIRRVLRNGRDDHDEARVRKTRGLGGRCHFPRRKACGLCPGIRLLPQGQDRCSRILRG
jgi:hypothetical protein